jgi:MFS family permease
VNQWLPPRASRRNFTVMGLDVSFFSLALSFASVYGVLPLFVQHLSTSNLAIGAIPAVRSTLYLPPIFVAGLTERLARKQPFVLGVTVFERLPYLVLAIATPLLATTRPTTLLWLFFAMIAVTTIAGGATMPAWIDLIARMMPDDWRGRFFGLSSAFGGLLGIGGSAGAAALLSRYTWSTGIALCFACCFAFMIVSFVFLALGREPVPETPVVTASHRQTGAWRRLPALVRQDRNLRWYLVAIAFVTSASAAAPFYIVEAKHRLGLSDAAASLYAVVLLAASTAGSVLWGYVGDRLGHKRVVLGGALCAGLAAALALALRQPVGFGFVFLLVGLSTSGFQLSSLTFIVDLAPIDQRPTYVGLAMFTQTPFAAIAPLLIALVADEGGYGAVFALTAALALAALLLVWLAVHDPRKGVK